MIMSDNTINHFKVSYRLRSSNYHMDNYIQKYALSKGLRWPGIHSNDDDEFRNLGFNDRLTIQRGELRRGSNKLYTDKNYIFVSLREILQIIDEISIRKNT